MSKEESSESTYIKNLVDAFVEKQGVEQESEDDVTQDVADEPDDNTKIQESFTFF